jgi:hypothetical protein
MSKHWSGYVEINKDEESGDPLGVLGGLIEPYMEAVDEGVEDPFGFGVACNLTPNRDRKAKIADVLMRSNLIYVSGGKIAGALGTPSRSLEQQIRNKEIGSVTHEFERALENVEVSPREAVSAACNILESICKVYIEDERLEKPAKQDLKPIWTIVRNHLGFDPSRLEDNDLKTILTGLFATVDGIGALRTHASSAHGAGRRPYKLEPRHARLAVHAAHTIALFVLESWNKKKLSQ